MKPERYGTSVAFLSTFFTASNITLAKLGVQFIPAFVFAGMSFTIAGLLLTCIAVAGRKTTELLSIAREQFLGVIWIAIVGISIPFVLIFYALSSAPLANSFLLQTELLYSDT